MSTSWILHAVLTMVSSHKKLTIEVERAKKKMKQVTKNNFVFCGMNNPMHPYSLGGNLLEGPRAQADHESRVCPWGKDDPSMRKNITSTLREVGDPFSLPSTVETCIGCAGVPVYEMWTCRSKSNEGPQT